MIGGDMGCRLILLRHGESLYNRKNIFTGWIDVDLSEKGIKEAKEAGRIMRQNDLFPDICFTSWLKRAVHTANLALGEMEWEHIDTLRSWKLNERHYGDWQGRDKDEVRKEVGEEVFKAVRRGYETSPPALRKDDERSPFFDPKYRSLDPSLIPLGESLKDTRRRVVNYFFEKIAPFLVSEKTVLITAHGNSLRALVMYIENISKEEISKVEIPTARPILYEFDKELNPLFRKDF